MSRIRRARHQKGFVTTSNCIAQSSTLSLRAKGLFIYLMSLPDNFEIQVQFLIKNSKEGKDVIYKTLNELKCAGLLDRQERREKNGRIASPDYIIYDEVQPDLVEKYRESPADKEQTRTVVPEEEIRAPTFSDAVEPPHKNKYSKNKYYKQKQAAAIASAEQAHGEGKASVPHTAAAFPEKLIGETLTTSQQACVEQVANAYSAQYQEQLGGKTAEALFHELCHDLENANAWRNCGNDFEKKLNTLKKAIRQGQWKTPAALLHAFSGKSGTLQRSEAPYTGKVKALIAAFHEQLHELNGHVQACQGLLADCPAFVAQETEKAMQCRERLAEVKHALVRYGLWEHTSANTAPDLMRLLPLQQASHNLENVASSAEMTVHSSFTNPTEERAAC